MGLFITASEVLFSADIGLSLKIHFCFTNYEGGYPKSGSLLTAWEMLAIHPRVRDNRVLIGLGCSFKKSDHSKLFYFVNMKMNNSTRYNREILSNQYSISRLFFTELSPSVPSYVRGSKP